MIKLHFRAHFMHYTVFVHTFRKSSGTSRETDRSQRSLVMGTSSIPNCSDRSVFRSLASAELSIRFRSIELSPPIQVCTMITHLRGRMLLPTVHTTGKHTSAPFSARRGLSLRAEASECPESGVQPRSVRAGDARVGGLVAGRRAHAPQVCRGRSLQQRAAPVRRARLPGAHHHLVLRAASPASGARRRLGARAVRAHRRGHDHRLGYSSALLSSNLPNYL